MISRRPNRRASIEYAPGPEPRIASRIEIPKTRDMDESKTAPPQAGITLLAMSAN